LGKNVPLPIREVTLIPGWIYEFRGGESLNRKGFEDYGFGFNLSMRQFDGRYWLEVDGGWILLVVLNADIRQYDQANSIG